MKQKLWRFLTKNIPEGSYLPKWAMITRFVLFPIDSFYWIHSKQCGYDFYTDTWRIGCVRYSAGSLETLAKSQGETYKITRQGDTVILKRVSG